MPKPTRLDDLPVHYFFGGRGWDPHYVFWGERGAGNKAALDGRCVWLKGAGAPGDVERSFCKVSVAPVAAAYALFREDRLVYAGEGELGVRLKRHWDDPDLLWDRFSWIAPGTYSYGVNAAAVSQPNPVEIGTAVTPKALCEFLETLSIAFGRPSANSQVPEDQGINTLWLDQVEHDGAKGRIEDRLDRIYKAIKEIK